MPPVVPGTIEHFQRASSGGWRRRWIRYAVSFAAAAGAHAALLFAWKSGALRPAEFGPAEAGGAVDVELSAREAPAAAPAIAEPPPAASEPEPLAPEPVPASMPAESAPEPAPQTTPPPSTESTETPPHPASASAAAVRAPRPPQAKAPPQSGRAGEPAKATQGAAGGQAMSDAAGGAGRGATKPGYLSCPHPPYPPESKAGREQGVVLLRVVVGADGRVDSLSLQKSSGYSRLDAAALEAVRRWRFRPGTLNGVPHGNHGLRTGALQPQGLTGERVRPPMGCSRANRRGSRSFGYAGCEMRRG